MASDNLRGFGEKNSTYTKIAMNKILLEFIHEVLKLLKNSLPCFTFY